MATLSVGAGRQYATIAAAAAAARDGDVIAVAAGTYLDDLVVLRKKVSLVAVGGQVTLMATRPVASGGALITVAADATVQGFVVAGAHAADGSAAGIAVQGASLTLQGSLVVGSDNGVLASAAASATIAIAGSEVADNGTGDAFGRNVSVGAVKALVVQDSFIHDAAGGAELRSLAASTTITGTRIADNGATGLGGIELPTGGAVLLRNDVIESGAGTTAAAIRYGGGALQAGSSLSITGSTLVADRPGAVAVQNKAATVTASIAANTLYGFAGVASGNAVLAANQVTTARPPVSTDAQVVPVLPLPVEYGRAGAIAASGRVLSVGAGGRYASLAEALAAARDGDTIQLAAGHYAIDPVILTRALTIEGVGGLATLTAAHLPGDGAALLTTGASLTLRNLAITGVAAWGGVAAAVRSTGGVLTIVNSVITANQAGVVADGGATGVVAIYDSELAGNGIADGRGGNLVVGAIGTLTLRNDWVHDGIAAAEITSSAANTVIDATRIDQERGNGAADLLLPVGGRVTITASVVEKGAWSQPGPMVQVGTASAGSSISVSGSSLLADQSAPGVLIASGAAPATLSGGQVQGATVGAGLVANGSVSGVVAVAGLAVADGSPWGATGAPVAGTLTQSAQTGTASGFGVLVLRVSEAAYRGHARFTLTVDGVAVGGTLTATADHAAGESQTVTIAGTFSAGAHTVGVQYVNDLGSRALYVDGLSFDSEETGQTATLAVNGGVLLSTGAVAGPTPVTLSLSEQAGSGGDALCFVAIDGQVQGGPLRVTAAHAAGATEPMRFLLDLAPGAHTVALTQLNPASGALLYVDRMEVAGAMVGGVTDQVRGAATYAFTVPPQATGNGSLFVTVGSPQDLIVPG